MSDSPASGPAKRRSAPGKKPANSDISRRSGHGFLAVGANLPTLAAPALRKRGFAQARLITEWPAIVGELLARETLPQKLSFPRGSKTDAILHLRVASGFAIELQHMAPQIVDRINAFFGYRAVADLRYVQGPIPPVRKPRRVQLPRLPEVDEARLQRDTDGIEDAALRDSLRRLGRAVGAGRESRIRR